MFAVHQTRDISLWRQSTAFRRSVKKAAYENEAGTQNLAREGGDRYVCGGELAHSLCETLIADVQRYR